MCELCGRRGLPLDVHRWHDPLGGPGLVACRDGRACQARLDARRKEDDRAR